MGDINLDVNTILVIRDFERFQQTRPPRNLVTSISLINLSKIRDSTKGNSKIEFPPKTISQVYWKDYLQIV